MNVKEALITAEKIGAAVNIPNHYDKMCIRDSLNTVTEVL